MEIMTVLHPAQEKEDYGPHLSRHRLYQGMQTD
jgi:hypothetical protein